MFTSYVRAMGKAAGARHEFCGPMAKQQRMALLTAVAAATGLCPAEWLPARTAFGGRGLVAAALAVILVGSLATAARRLARIAACATAPAKCTCNAESTLSPHHGGPAFCQAAASRTEPLHQIRTCLLRA